MYSARYFCTIVTKFGIPRQIFIKVFNTKFYRKSVQWEPHWSMRTDRQKDVETDGYDKGNGVFCYNANKPKICYISVNEIILAPSCKFIIRMTDWLAKILQLFCHCVQEKPVVVSRFVFVKLICRGDNMHTRQITISPHTEVLSPTRNETSYSDRRF